MAFLYSGYFDDSDTQQWPRMAGFGGFISGLDDWVEFSKEWKAALQEFDGLQFFHMTDFENRKGPYATWSDAQRKERLNRLLEIIAKYPLSSVGCVIPVDRFNALLSPVAKAVCGSPYGLAALTCFRLQAELANSADAYLAYVLEKGTKGQGVLLDIYRDKKFGQSNLENHRIDSITLGDKVRFPPLQAADILIYELCKHLPRQMGLVNRPIRYPFTKLHHPTSQWGYLNDARLSELDRELSSAVSEG